MLVKTVNKYEIMTYVFCFFILVIAEVVYFKIANKYNIIDKPNHRSSHTQVTIRGGGIIFPLAVLFWFVSSGFQYPFFVCGVVLVACVSFIDDIKDISRRARVLIHILSVSLIFYQLQIFTVGWLALVLGYIFFIGVINAYNFMDGINGITGLYSFVTIGTLFWINQFRTHFIDNDLLIAVMLSLVVFGFFNFRKRAKCFSGDVGSIAMALIICFLLCKLMLQTNQPLYILLLLIYGIDVIATILVRLSKKENIFLAHRQHLYQLLVNQANYLHLSVALLYALMQLIINIALINIINKSIYLYLLLIIATSLIFYIIIRRKVTPHTAAQ